MGEVVPLPRGETRQKRRPSICYEQMCVREVSRYCRPLSGAFCSRWKAVLWNWEHIVSKNLVMMLVYVVLVCGVCIIGTADVFQQ